MTYFLLRLSYPPLFLKIVQSMGIKTVPVPFRKELCIYKTEARMSVMSRTR